MYFSVLKILTIIVFIFYILLKFLKFKNKQITKKEFFKKIIICLFCYIYVWLIPSEIMNKTNYRIILDYIFISLLLFKW